MRRYLPIICVLAGLTMVAVSFTVTLPPLYEKGLIREIGSEPAAMLALGGVILAFTGGAWQVFRRIINKLN